MRATCLTLIIACALLVPALAQIPGGRGGVAVGGVMGPGIAQPTPKSEEELKAEIANRPADFGPYIELARLYQSVNRLDEAERVLRDGLGYHPASGPLFSTLVNLFAFAKTNPERMLAAADEWMRADPSSSMAVASAANAHSLFAAQTRGNPAEAVGHLDQGLQVLDTAMQTRPDDPLLRRTRSMMLATKAQFVSDPAERESLMREARKTSERMGVQGGVPFGAGIGAVSRGAWGSNATSAALAGGAVRVGSGIRTPTKIRDVKPIYPPEAQEARVQGVVLLEVDIDAAGKVTDARVLRSIPQLDQAALDAVRQWEFTTTEINGGPVPVIMTVTVQFTLQP